MGGKQGRMAHRKSRKSDKQAGIGNKQDGTADTLRRMQTDEQLVDHNLDHSSSGRRGGSGDQQGGVRVERHVEIEVDGRSGMDDKQDGINDGQDRMTNENDCDEMTNDQGVLADTLEVAATNARYPVMQPGIIIYQKAVGKSYEAKDSSSSKAGSAKGIDSIAQPSGLEIDCSKPLSDALRNIFSNNYSIIITLPPNSDSHQITTDLRYIQQLIHTLDNADAESHVSRCVTHADQVMVCYETIIQCHRRDILHRIENSDIGVVDHAVIAVTLTTEDEEVLAVDPHSNFRVHFKMRPSDDNYDDCSIFLRVKFQGDCTSEVMFISLKTLQPISCNLHRELSTNPPGTNIDWLDLVLQRFEDDQYRTTILFIEDEGDDRRISIRLVSNSDDGWIGKATGNFAMISNTITPLYLRPYQCSVIS